MKKIIILSAFLLTLFNVSAQETETDRMNILRENYNKSMEYDTEIGLIRRFNSKVSIEQFLKETSNLYPHLEKVEKWFEDNLDKTKFTSVEEAITLYRKMYETTEQNLKTRGYLPIEE
ncbi:hypothetical protein AB4865_05780 [Capnocytophaga sp. ARDL2]|uniref:hypothetical protein n=1 Tax=Capnocytophaga sp. ARDL2 TaxID=3238809 RepID=UPI0035588025